MSSLLLLPFHTLDHLLEHIVSQFCKNGWKSLLSLEFHSKKGILYLKHCKNHLLFDHGF